MRHNFAIAGISIAVDLPFPLIVSEESEPFYRGTDEQPISHLFSFEPRESIAVPDDPGVSVSDFTFFQKDDGFYAVRFLGPGRTPIACVRWRYDAPSVIFCGYLPEMEARLNLSRNILSLIGLETILLINKRLLLHCSFIRCGEKGILFTGPSGTGKSTQANLWVARRNAEILNGDRCALANMGDHWRGFGLPFAGTSGIYRNESAPIAAIVVLRQAKENSIRRLRPAEALRYLYPELSMHRWDSQFVTMTMDPATALTMELPVYLLECLPDYGAVDLVYDTIFRGDFA